MCKCLVPFLLFTFSHSQAPPLRIPVFVPAVLIDRLFIFGPTAACALDEIIMVIVIFCGDDKEDEFHRVWNLWRRDQTIVNILYVTAPTHNNNLREKEKL